MKHKRSSLLGYLYLREVPIQSPELAPHIYDGRRLWSNENTVMRILTHHGGHVDKPICGNAAASPRLSPM